jgi:hypothetical protein
MRKRRSGARGRAPAPCVAQFTLLVAVNAFVGAMVGLERSTLPLIGRDAGVVTDAVDYAAAIALIATLTALSGLWVAYDLPGRQARARIALSHERRQAA